MRFENWLYTLPLRIRTVVLRRRQNAELDEELRDHIARQIEENLARGMDNEEARAAAVRILRRVKVQLQNECSGPPLYLSSPASTRSGRRFCGGGSGQVAKSFRAQGGL